MLSLTLTRMYLDMREFTKYDGHFFFMNDTKGMHKVPSHSGMVIIISKMTLLVASTLCVFDYC